MIEREPKPDDVRALEEHLYDFNVLATGIRDGAFVTSFLRDDPGEVIGGIHGWTWGETCYVRYLFIPEALCQQGHGARLMRVVEAEAKARGCRQMLLETHDFQAPDFYRRLGFEIAGCVDGYPRGHQFLTMVKHLA